MADAETVPVPISEDEAESPSKKAAGAKPVKKRQATEAAPAVGELVSLSVLQQLLENQMRERREAQKLENARALGQVQLEVRKSIGELCDDEDGQHTAGWLQCEDG